MYDTDSDTLFLLQLFENVYCSKVSTLKCDSPKLGHFRSKNGFLFAITFLILVPFLNSTKSLVGKQLKY